MRRCWNREEVRESQGPRVPRPRGPKDQDISNPHSNTSLTLKKVHLVVPPFYFLHDAGAFVEEGSYNVKYCYKF